MAGICDVPVVDPGPVNQRVAGRCPAAGLFIAEVEHELIGVECVGILVLNRRGCDYRGQPEGRPAPSYAIPWLVLGVGLSSQNDDADEPGAGAAAALAATRR